MRTCRTHLAVVLAMFFQAAPAVAVAQSTVDVERQKAHVVSRLYQATYGAELRCRPSKEASSSFSKAMDQFRSAFPELMRLIDGSPYLPPAREQFNKFLADPSAKVSDEALIEECRGLEYMLRLFIEAPGGKDTVNGYLQLLRK
jgi:hypothetical protein